MLGGRQSISLSIVTLMLANKDALEAYDRGLNGVVLSNHGGRQLDFARSGIEVLVEVAAKLKEMRGVVLPIDRFQVFIDGGVRRATDVIKAIALGATAGEHGLSSTSDGPSFPHIVIVGIGRPFLYAYSSYGAEGIDRALQILHVCAVLILPFGKRLGADLMMFKDEFEMNMRLLGSRTVKEIVPDMVDASNIHMHTVPVPVDNLYEGNCASFHFTFHFRFIIRTCPYGSRRFFQLNLVKVAGKLTILVHSR